jgi:predicted transglutaminase-like cysteine proteinase
LHIPVLWGFEEDLGLGINTMRQTKTGIFKGLASRFERNRLGELLVQRGRVSTEQLHNALKNQKGSGQTLGQILQAQGLVTKTQIRTTLFEQAAYRTIATCLTLFIGFSSFNMGSAKASSLNPRAHYSDSSMIQKVAYQPKSQMVRPQQAAPSNKLFGSREVASKDISAFTKWTSILGRMDNVSFDASKTAQFRNMGFDAKVNAVNNYVNQVRYIEDKHNFGKSDYWATPAEFFARGGDCEDFAIAKYAMLKQLGVPESKMRLAIVQDKVKNIPHAVLIVYTDNGPMLLDNQIKRTSQVASVNRYKPIYSINASGWWRHLG